MPFINSAARRLWKTTKTCSLRPVKRRLPNLRNASASTSPSENSGMTAWRLSGSASIATPSCNRSRRPFLLYHHYPGKSKPMKRTKHILLAVFVLILASLACNAVLPQAEPTSVPTQVPTRVLVPTQVTEPASTQPDASLPQTDAQVSRVPPDQAKAALDGGDAIIVDVRGAAAYAQQHIA